MTTRAQALDDAESILTTATISLPTEVMAELCAIRDLL